MKGLYMKYIFLFSVLLKGVGALLEIVLQIMITHKMGVSGYGSYTAWISAADLVFWVCFSGLIKCNTFYLPGRNVSIGQFKRKYAFLYVLPVLGILAAVGVKETFAVVIPLITALELMVLDRSSTMLAHGRNGASVAGEYVLGRSVLVVGVALLGYMELLNHRTLLVLYCVQYLVILAFFYVFGGRENKSCIDISKEVSLRKWGAFQRSDLMHSMIEQMPVVLQYLFSGAFEAGVVSIVLLVKKLINFISGPTAKVFLPEFSRLYHAGEHREIRRSYGDIMRIQMLVVSPLTVVLLGFPGVIIKILAPELSGYTGIFQLCSVIFLAAAALGPCGGVLQMTEHEKQDNRCRGGALLAMLLVMVHFRSDPYFVLYGLCTQAAVEAAAKYICICKWMKGSPIGIKEYILWWVLPGTVIIGVYILDWSGSFAAMVSSAGSVFLLTLLYEFLRRKGE